MVYLTHNNNTRLSVKKQFVLTLVGIGELKKIASIDVNNAFKATTFSHVFHDFSSVFDGSFHRITVAHVFFQCINICRVPWKKFEYSAYRARVQTTSSGSGMKNDPYIILLV